MRRTKKTRTELVSVFGLVCGLLGAAPPEVFASCAEDVARSVQTHYDSVRDFRAEFEQTTRSVLFGSAGGFGAAGSGLSVPIRGEVVFAKPGKMRWTYTEPEPSLVVSDGQTLWIYSPVLKEAQRLPVTEGYLTGAALQFLLGEGKLLESFKVTSESCPFEPNVDKFGKQIPRVTVELELEPKQPTSYERLGLTANLATGAVVATRVVDLFGNETVIAFEKIEQNLDPSADTFHFVPGDDVEVIELQSIP